MTQPNVLAGRAKPVINLKAALAATIRTWMLYRDEALWAFVGGTEADKPLEEIELGEEVQAHVTEANEAARRAWAMAEKIAQANEQKVATVMREAISDVLAAERPQFLLALEHIPGSF